MAKYKVLSTKKLEPSLIKQAGENDIEIIEQEFISIEPVLTYQSIHHFFLLLKKPYAVFTSTNAVTSFTHYLHPEKDPEYEPSWKIFCLAGKTKEAILKIEQMKEKIIAEADNATNLAHKIIESGAKEIVFVCGNKRRDELPVLLNKAGIEIHELTVYETTETPVAITEDLDAILFFSPSAVQSFFSVNQLKKNTVCFAIGETTARSISDATDNRIIVSKSPSRETMLASVHSYFQNMNSSE